MKSRKKSLIQFSFQQIRKKFGSEIQNNLIVDLFIYFFKNIEIQLYLKYLLISSLTHFQLYGTFIYCQVNYLFLNLVSRLDFSNVTEQKTQHYKNGKIDYNSIYFQK